MHIIGIRAIQPRDGDQHYNIDTWSGIGKRWKVQIGSIVGSSGDAKIPMVSTCTGTIVTEINGEIDTGNDHRIGKNCGYGSNYHRITIRNIKLKIAAVRADQNIVTVFF